MTSNVEFHPRKFYPTTIDDNPNYETSSQEKKKLKRKSLAGLVNPMMSMTNNESFNNNVTQTTNNESIVGYSLQKNSQ